MPSENANEQDIEMPQRRHELRLGKLMVSEQILVKQFLREFHFYPTIISSSSERKQ